MLRFCPICNKKMNFKNSISVVWMTSFRCNMCDSKVHVSPMEDDSPLNGLAVILISGLATYSMVTHNLVLLVIVVFLIVIYLINKALRVSLSGNEITTRPYSIKDLIKKCFFSMLFSLLSPVMIFGLLVYFFGIGSSFLPEIFPNITPSDLVLAYVVHAIVTFLHLAYVDFHLTSKVKLLFIYFEAIVFALATISVARHVL